MGFSRAFRSLSTGRKLGYCLLLLGFLWVEYFALQVRPWARAAETAHRQKLPDLQQFSRREVLNAYSGAADEVSNFAQLGWIGGVLMLVGGIVLAKENSSAVQSKAQQD